MKIRRIDSVCLLFAIPFLALAAAQANQAPAPPDKLPEAPGKAVLTRVCTVCHGVDVIVDTPRTVPVWVDTVLLMKDFGAEASDEDWKTVTDYLIVHLAHLDVNKATAREIGQVFGVSDAIAAGVVAYRDTQGGFKSLDDLKKAPDLDAGKIDAVKERLIFGGR